MMGTSCNDGRPGQEPRGMIGAIALVILGILATLGLALLTAAQVDRYGSTRTRSRTDAFYVAEGGLQVVVNGLKTNASNVVRATFPVMPTQLVDAGDWGFTSANYPGGIVFNNMAGGVFTPDDPTSNVVVTLPGIGRGTARVTVWLRSVGATVADPVVFSVTSVGTLPNLTSRTVLADATLTPRGGRPPNPLQTGGLEGPVLNLLVAGGTSVSGTVLDGGANVRILKRVGNNWQQVGSNVTAANAPAGGPYAFNLNLTNSLVRGDIYSAQSQVNNGPWSPMAFPVVVE